MGLGALQPMHILLIVAIVVIVFGPSKLPELGSSLGKGIREFRKTSDDIKGVKEAVTDPFKDVKESVTSAISLEPTRPTAASSSVAAPLPSKPEPRHETVTLARQEID